MQFFSGLTAPPIFLPAVGAFAQGMVVSVPIHYERDLTKTSGDVGAALSHLRVAERAHAEGVQLQLVLEDDATLLPDAIPALLREVRLLKAAKVRWDLIYLGGSAQYCKAAEPAVSAPGSCLRVAGHRKVCMAYALSAEGARKLATCGYRASILPVDDLLPG